MLALVVLLRVDRHPVGPAVFAQLGERGAVGEADVLVQALQIHSETPVVARGLELALFSGFLCRAILLEDHPLVLGGRLLPRKCL